MIESDTIDSTTLPFLQEAIFCGLGPDGTPGLRTLSLIVRVLGLEVRESSLEGRSSRRIGERSRGRVRRRRRGGRRGKESTPAGPGGGKAEVVACDESGVFGTPNELFAETVVE